MRSLAVDVWSHWSLLKALSSPQEVARTAVAHGYEALILADWESLAGTWGLVDACQRAGIQGILGVTVPIAGPTGTWMVRIVARNRNGWARLCRLATPGPPRTWPDIMDPSLLVILPSEARLGGHLSDDASSPLFRLVTDPDDRTCPELIPLASWPIRYPSEKDREAWTVLTRLGGTHDNVAGAAWIDAAQMREKFGLNHPALIGWEQFLDRIEEATVPASQARLPQWPKTGGVSPSVLLRDQALMGLAKRLGNPVPAPYMVRLEDELRIIADLGYASYFLIVADLVAYARREAIRVGPGRGSAAGSLVAYALGITELDPLKWDLVFERFLNPARKTLPDIDLDIEDLRRMELVEYLKQRYGRDRVAQIGTYGTLGARAALRDTGRVLGINPDVVDQVAQTLNAQPQLSLSEARSLVPQWDRLMQQPDLAKWWHIAERLEGTPRHASIHAAGVVIAPGAIVDWSPLLGDQEQAVTQIDMRGLERLGLLKLDLLGLRTLTVIERVQAWAGPSTRLSSMAEVPDRDVPTLRLLATGQTDAVFQLDGRGVKELLRRMKPEALADVMTVVALYRPGPMDQIPEYLRRRQGPWRPQDDEWEGILDDTYGILVYQEQLMALVRHVAGYSWAEADLFRRAVSKKDRGVLSRERERFLARATQGGRGAHAAERLWQRIFAFADYGFNKAHAAAYGLLAYYTAYLKAHWPVSFWAAELSTLGHGERLRSGVLAALNEGLTVERPHVNRSWAQTRPEEGRVRLGLDVIRGMGGMAADMVVLERERAGPYHDFGQFLSRVGCRLPGKACEQLIKAGALEGLGSPATLGDYVAQGSQQLSWLDRAPMGPSDTADWDREAFGWPWPGFFDQVYIQVESAPSDWRRQIAAVAERWPGVVPVAIVERGSRRGTRLSTRLEVTVDSMRALREIEGVTAVAMGMREDRKAGRRS